MTRVLFTIMAGNRYHDLDCDAERRYECSCKTIDPVSTSLTMCQIGHRLTVDCRYSVLLREEFIDEKEIDFSFVQRDTCCSVINSAAGRRAGPGAFYRHVGGRALSAYEASGVQDGSGFPWCTIQVMDTKSNSAADPVHVTDNDDKMVYSPAEVVKACRTLALPLLDRHGILDRIRGKGFPRTAHRADHLPARGARRFSIAGPALHLNCADTAATVMRSRQYPSAACSSPDCAKSGKTAADGAS